MESIYIAEAAVRHVVISYRNPKVLRYVGAVRKHGPGILNPGGAPVWSCRHKHLKTSTAKKCAEDYARRQGWQLLR